MKHLFVLLLLSVLATPVTSPAQTKDQYTYRRLEGMIGKQPVVVHLHLQKTTVPGEGLTKRYFGVYYYKKFDAPIPFYGNSAGGDSLILAESAGNESTGSLTLLPTPAGGLRGIWKGGEGKTDQPVDLREAYTSGAIKFKGQMRRAEKKMFLKLKESPTASASAGWLEPVEGTDPTLRDLLTREMAALMSPTTPQTPPCCRNPEEAFKARRDTLFKHYPGELAKEVDPKAPDQFFMYSQTDDVQIAIQYNGPDYLTLAATDFAYAGGAHGNYATEYRTFRLSDKKPVKLADFLKPGYQKTLEAALEKAARKRSGLSDKAKIDEYYLVSKIPATENFFPTATGLTFSYPPYEIASYADGQVELFISFEDLKGFLKN